MTQPRNEISGPVSPIPRTSQRKRLERVDPRLPITELFSEHRARQLWESLPEDHRQDHVDSKNMPSDYRVAFRERTTGRQGGRWTTQAISLRGLPEPMTWELAWFIHREVTAGNVINPTRFNSVRYGLWQVTGYGSPAGRQARSVTALPVEEWAYELRRAQMKQGPGSVGAMVGNTMSSQLKRVQDRLAYAYHDGPWWQLNVWSPLLDDRIPLREHEPHRNSAANFSHLTTDWLREAVKWWLSAQLLGGQYVWSSVKSRVDHFKWFQWYLDQVGCAGPHLADSFVDLRPFTRGFVELLRAHRIQVGPNKGKPLGKNQVRQPLVTVETFYRWMFDNVAKTTTVLGEPGWQQLTPQHTTLFRPEDKPRLVNKLPDDMARDVQTRSPHW